MSDLLPVTTPETETDPTSENIAAYSDWGWFGGDIALPQTIDEAERVYGREIYDRMAHDANLAAAVRFLKAKVLKGGLSVQPSHEAPDPNEVDGPEKQARQRKHDQAVELSDFVRYNLARLRKPGERVIEVIYELLNCVYKGNRLAEINTQLADTGPYAGDRILVSIRPKPNANYAFVVRSLGGVVGVTAIEPGKAPYVRQGIVFDPRQLPSLISPDKVIVMRFGGHNGDPRGESVFRDAYDAWLDRQQLKAEARKVDKQFAGGRVKGELDKDAPAEVDPVDVSAKLAKWNTSGVFVGPRGLTAGIEWPNANPSWYEFRDRTFREEMVMAVLVNARQILAAERGSEKDSGVAQDAGDEVIGWFKDLAQSQIEGQLFYSLCLWKYGEEIASEYCPKCVLGSSVNPDFAANVTAMSSAGYEIDDSQVIPMERAAGIPVRSTDWVKRRDERAANEAQTQNANQAPQTGTQPQQKDISARGPEGGVMLKRPLITDLSLGEEEPTEEEQKGRHHYLVLAYLFMQNEASDRLEQLSSALADERLTVSQWADEFRKEMRERHAEAWAVGRRLAGDMAPHSAIDQKSGYDAWEGQEQFFTKFVDDLNGSRYDNPDGSLKEKQVAARSDAYAHSLKRTVNEAFLNELGEDLARWVLGDLLHCGPTEGFEFNCPDLSEEDPKPANEWPTVPRGGDTPCLYRCGCWMESADGKYSTEGI